MKILYDGIIYNTQLAGGINRYFANLIDGLPDDISPAITTYRIPTVNWPRNPNLKVLRYRKFRPRRISNFLENRYFEQTTAPSKYDVFHPTYYAPLAKIDWDNYHCPMTLTVYDMIHELFADEMDPTGAFAAQKRAAVMAAQTVLCISEHTKHDLMRYYSVEESKIKVIYLAAELGANLSHGPEPVPARPYFFYVGTRASYKNFVTLLKALSKLVTVNNNVTLCLVGSPLTTEENNLIDDLGLKNHVEHFGYASDSHLAKLYRCSLAFVYPSLYEGFGIPPLEAMQCGTIVVASNVSSIPEVVGDAAISFDPHNVAELTDILLSVMDGSVEREAIIERGYGRAKQFTWEKTVSQTVDVYRSLAF